MSNPLFRNFERALREEIEREAMAARLQQVVKSRSVMRGARRLMSETSGMSEVQRNGKIADFVREKIIAEVVKQFGALGSVVSAMMRPQGKALTGDLRTEVDSIMDVLRSLTEPEPEVPARPEWFKGPKRGGTPQPEPPAPPREAVPEGFVSRQVIGRRYKFAADDPILTGEMIDVISSNVHSIGYEWNEENPSKGTLKVRFLEHAGRKSRTRIAGPLYDYFGVHPDVFKAFQIAASKGKFVWDRLRVRGTVSGSRYHYELEDTGATNYVPRKATRLGPNEYFLRREHTDRRTGQTSQSALQDEFVRRLGTNRNGPQGFVPQRGAPNRGAPNRGR